MQNEIGKKITKYNLSKQKAEREFDSFLAVEEDDIKDLNPQIDQNGRYMRRAIIGNQDILDQGKNAKIQRDK